MNETTTMKEPPTFFNVKKGSSFFAGFRYSWNTTKATVRVVSLLQITKLGPFFAATYLCTCTLITEAWLEKAEKIGYSWKFTNHFPRPQIQIGQQCKSPTTKSLQLCAASKSRIVKKNCQSKEAFQIGVGHFPLTHIDNRPGTFFCGSGCWLASHQGTAISWCLILRWLREEYTQSWVQTHTNCCNRSSSSSNSGGPCTLSIWPPHCDDLQAANGRTNAGSEQSPLFKWPPFLRHISPVSECVRKKLLLLLVSMGFLNDVSPFDGFEI